MKEGKEGKREKERKEEKVTRDQFLNDQQKAI
jgi:hypothetical protein